MAPGHLDLRYFTPKNNKGEAKKVINAVHGAHLCVAFPPGVCMYRSMCNLQCEGWSLWRHVFDIWATRFSGPLRAVFILCAVFIHSNLPRIVFRYGRRLLLEYAKEDEGLDELRAKTKAHMDGGRPSTKRRKTEGLGIAED